MIVDGGLRAYHMTRDAQEDRNLEEIIFAKNRGCHSKAWDAILGELILPMSQNVLVSMQTHSKGMIPNLERSRMDNPPRLHIQGMGNYSSVIEGTNEK